MVRPKNKSVDRSPRRLSLTQRARDLLRPALLSLGFLVLYVALDQHTVGFQEWPVTSAWHPPAGLGFALLLAFGLRCLPLYCLAELLAFLVNWELRLHFLPLLVLSAISPFAYGLAAMVLRRQRWIYLRLRRVSGMATFIVVTLVSSLLGALLTCAWLAVQGFTAWHDYFASTLTWWVGDALGIFTLTPFLIAYAVPWSRALAAKAGSAEKIWRRPGGWQILETAAQATGIVLALWVAFDPRIFGTRAFVYLPFLPLIWLSLRHGLPGTMVGIAAVNAGAMLAVRIFHSPLSGLTPMQFRMLAWSLTGLLLGAVVSERRWTQTALKKTRDLNSAIVDTTDALILVLDPEGRIVRFNPACERASGYRFAEVQGRSLWDLLLPPEEVEPVKAIFTVLRRGAFPNEHKNYWRRKDGGHRLIAWSNTCIAGEDDSVEYVIGTGIDVTEQEQAEASLRRSEEYFRALTQNAQDIIVILGADGTIRYASPSMKTVLGYELRLLQGRDALALIHPDDVAKVKDRFTRKLQGDAVIQPIEFRVRRQDGSWRVLEAVGRNLLEDPLVSGVVINCRDITERKRAEEALRLTQFSLDHAAEAAFWTGPDARIHYVNEMACRSLGYSREELLSRTVFDINPNFTVGMWPEHWKKAGERGCFTLESVHRTKDGREFPVEVTINHLQFDGKEYHCSFARDITERKRLEQTQQRLASILEATTDFVGIADAEGHVLYANRALRTALGMRSGEEDAGLSIFDFHSEQFRKMVKNEAVPAAIRDGTWSGETTLRTREGREIPVSQVILAHKDPSGKVDFVSTIMRDLSERRKLEQQFLQAQKMEAVGRLAGGVAHDFNNMLGVILGYTQLMQERFGPEDPASRNLSEVKKAADRAAALTRQLLAFSRKQVLHPRILDLNGVVADMGKMLARMIGDDIELLIRPGASLGQVKADPGQLEQVLMNLAVNARDAMPKGGKLAIETANADLDKHYVQQHEPVVPGRYVMLAVSDTGCGMDAKTQARIFEPFFTTKELGKGTGLGLSTVYGIVKQSGGYIWVYSEPGHGTTFKIYLPRVEEAAARASQVNAAAMVARASATILLVEDEESLRGLARHFLEDAGYLVLEASNGQDALDLTRRHAGGIDLLLTDVVMPGMSGREIVQHLTQLRPGIRILYMSGYTDDIIARHGVLQPGTVLLEKPFARESLLNRVREALQDGAAKGQGSQ